MNIKRGQLRLSLLYYGTLEVFIVILRGQLRRSLLFTKQWTLEAATDILWDARGGHRYISGTIEAATVNYGSCKFGAPAQNFLIQGVQYFQSSSPPKEAYKIQVNWRFDCTDTHNNNFVSTLMYADTASPGDLW